ncbi:MAG: DinB family protein [Planctomycetes bacterium]|nr:DinB family protein [Planctomycetota bacterium]
MSRLSFAIEQIEIARSYTLRILGQTPQTDWFRIPPAGVSNIAWQVGHLTMAEYRLGIERIRPVTAADEKIVGPAFLARFGRGSTASADAASYPPIAEIAETFERVHLQLLSELPRLSEADLDAEVLKPHGFVKTKAESLTWISRHEMLHGGQIGLLRRQLGAPPLW